tara:strand:+ start:289 stop:507 length:219 start_codon:yes stop_codon:yes gene_type:complete
MKDASTQIYKRVNMLIDNMNNSEPKKEPKGLLNRTSRGISVGNNQNSDAPLMKVVQYVKQFRKMREGIKNGK